MPDILTCACEKPPTVVPTVEDFLYELLWRYNLILEIQKTPYADMMKPISFQMTTESGGVVLDKHFDYILKKIGNTFVYMEQNAFSLLLESDVKCIDEMNKAYDKFWAYYNIGIAVDLEKDADQLVNQRSYHLDNALRELLTFTCKLSQLTHMVEKKVL